MKKMMIAVCAIALAAVAQAASVTWKYTGTANEVNYTVYLFTHEVASSYESIDALIGDNVSSAQIASKKVGAKTSYVTPNTVAANSGIVKGEPLYFAILENSESTAFTYGVIDSASYIYDPDNQESATGVLGITAANATGTGTIGGGEAIPEPTSALMLLVGLAGLALKRKVA